MHITEKIKLQSILEKKDILYPVPEDGNWLTNFCEVGSATLFHSAINYKKTGLALIIWYQPLFSFVKIMGQGL